ncbi:hypothetical protein [Paraburkholderia pallida]|uniref:Uncharacterized protein n=1 Tax=Paraburkholderia pallida TaxID=2547399 RepID=A0A4P7CQ79_9BURK|nr:hypothetical protein [Paraburkholderia pallida]QBQ96089.1 hypothetical protein E1956_02115 [Paraburkholderia pallida]
MPAAQIETQKVDYEGFEIHISAMPAEEGGKRYTYTAYICHPGANAALPGHSVAYHADGDETFRSEQEAVEEAAHVGRSIIEGTHPDLSVLSLVTHGY